jgi:hypothetical protein
MRRTDALQGVSMAMILNLLRRFESGELNQEEARLTGAFFETPTARAPRDEGALLF